MMRFLLSLALLLTPTRASTQSKRSHTFPRNVLGTGIKNGSHDLIRRATRDLPQQFTPFIQARLASAPPQADVKEQATTFTPLLSKSALAACIAFVTGLADVVSYRRYGFYANMMTGNTIRLTTALAELRLWDVLMFGSLIMSYGAGVGIFRAIDLQRNQKSKSSSPSCFVVAPMVLSLFGLVDLLLHKRGDSGYRGFIPLLSVGFGMLNAASADVLGGTVTYAMTGHVSKLAQALVDHSIGKKKWRKGARTSARVMFFFACGIVSGTVLHNSKGATLGSLPPFTTLAIMYGVLLGLSNVSKPSLASWKLSQTRKAPVSPSQRRAASPVHNDDSIVDITMDGWTRMPPGPLPFQDGQEEMTSSP